jgi:hypothetical protein
MQPVTARLNGSVGLSLALGFGLMLEDMTVLLFRPLTFRRLCYMFTRMECETAYERT